MPRSEVNARVRSSVQSHVMGRLFTFWFSPPECDGALGDGDGARKVNVQIWEKVHPDPDERLLAGWRMQEADAGAHVVFASCARKRRRRQQQRRW